MKPVKSTSKKTSKKVTPPAALPGKRPVSPLPKTLPAKASVGSSAAPVPPTAAPRKSPAKPIVPQPSSPAPKGKKTAEQISPAEAPTKTTARRMPFEVPPILLEGDQPAAPPLGGPGQRYALGPVPPASAAGGAAVPQLPEAYGTQRLLLTARDPLWLYAHWDLTREQLRGYNAQARDRHLALRVFQGAIGPTPFVEVAVHPESRHWFVHVGRGGEKFLAQLGFHLPDGSWTTIATSDATLTPPDTISEDGTVRFATIPVEVPFSQVLPLAREVVRQNVPLVEVVEQLQAHGFPQFTLETIPPLVSDEPPALVVEETLPIPTPAPDFATGLPLEMAPAAIGWPEELKPPATPIANVPASKTTPTESGAPAVGPFTPVWTPEQERALASIITMDSVRRVWMGSLEITELIRRQLTREIASQAAAQFSHPTGLPVPPGTGALPSIAPWSSFSHAESQPAPGPGASNFWFNINAELILYGATEPDATVTIGGKPIKLRSDGTFSYRFALPDGHYDLPVVAIAADGSEGRAADLNFSRGTQYRGQVDAHPQDPALKAPLVVNVG